MSGELTSVELERLAGLLHEQHGEHGLLGLAQPEAGDVVLYFGVVHHSSELGSERLHLLQHRVHLCGTEEKEERRKKKEEA